MLGKKKDASAKEEKKNWYTDRYQTVVVQRNLLSVITIISLLGSAIAAFSISQLAPLKSVEPFVIQIDQKSGITQIVNPITATEFSGNEAVNEYFIVRFINARESFGLNNQENFDTVRVMADSETVYPSYLRDMSPSNPDGIAASLMSGESRFVKIGLITFSEARVDPDGTDIRRYQVNLAILNKDRTGNIAKKTNKIATLEIKFVPLKLTAADRYLNPLGFRVVNYRIDEDALSR